MYKSWVDYIENNKIDKFIMVLPRNGRYNCDAQEDFIPERRFSPACSISQNVLFGLDITSSVAGVLSGVVLFAAAIPAITILPVVMVGAAATAASVSVYSITRSATNIHDRRIHKEVICEIIYES